MYIKKIRVVNFKKFKDEEISFKDGVNILIGDNESGKSTILEAIDLVLKGSISKILQIGLKNLLNNDAVNEFLNNFNGDIKKLPELHVDVHIDDKGNEHQIYHGKCNYNDEESTGISLHCYPNQEYISEISENLRSDDPVFPYEYYNIEISTFSGSPYMGYGRKLNHIIFDNTQVYSEKALRDYIKKIYTNSQSVKDRNQFQYDYRKFREEFSMKYLAKVPTKSEYKFELDSNRSDLDRNISLSSDGINVRNRGKGELSFVMLEASLKKTSDDIDVVLLEEPENHLSHLKVQKLIKNIKDSKCRQIILTTHNSMIASRLDLKNCILLTQDKVTYFSNLDKATSIYFIKYPFHTFLEMILSKKVIIVEGRSEYLIVNKFLGIKLPNEAENIHIISAEGNYYSIKYYLNVAKIISVKTAALTDNDKNCDKLYNEFVKLYDKFGNIKIFYPDDDSIYTLEIALMEKNMKKLCKIFDVKEEELLKTLLKDKPATALKLFENITDDFIVPNYISNSFEWIKD